MALWDKIASQGNVEDRRGAALGGGGLGLAGILIVVALSVFGGEDLATTIGRLLSQLPSTSTSQQLQPDEFRGDDDYERFASAVIGSTNDVWKQQFETQGTQYREPRLVLFRSATQSGCGIASSQSGPHYCPEDSTIYLDETFFDELTSRLGAQGGDVAEAYVLAHEVGHHVQNQLGTLQNVMVKQQEQPDRANELSVRLELQADCLAGVWAHSVRNLSIFAPGEINEAVDAAQAVGDDRIQQRVNGQVSPETWTHGSAAQRVEWFNRGLDGGQLSTCTTTF